MTQTENIHESFEKSISEKRPFMVFRIPGRSIEMADSAAVTEFVFKPWKGEAFSIGSIKSRGIPPLPSETSKAEYEATFKKYRDAFRSNELQKAILSTIIREEKPEGFDAVDFFFRLSESYPEAFAYLLYHPNAGVWCGATPEILLEGDGEHFITTALAGTQSVKPSQRYEWGEKEKEEQELVSQHIRDILRNAGVMNLVESSPYTFQAADVVHLKTDFQFDYRGDVKSLLDRLHPTPAVAGLPTPNSIDLINASENHERGLYTGYLGVLEEKETHVFVNLRCMQIGAEKLALYVGGGITAKSDMNSEWEETRLKAKTLLNLLKSTT